MKKYSLLLLAFFLITGIVRAEDGYRLWLRYDQVSDEKILANYRKTITGWMCEEDSPVLNAARGELQKGLNGLLDAAIPAVKNYTNGNIIIVGTPAGSPAIKSLIQADLLKDIGAEGFAIERITTGKKSVIVIAGNTDKGVLYGVFHFLRLIQTHQDIGKVSVKSSPRVNHRLLNHWDNLDRTVERGYAGFSLWDWHKLPDFRDPRYTDYARANASIGINGTVVTNVNANALILTPAYLEKVAALADIFRPWGIKIYLTARFSAPIEIGRLKTADPLNDTVRQWWTEKIDEVYRYVPDFGGFLVKANSEGQPGPQNYGRNHADGANMLAEALEPHGGIVMWRAFVYDDKEPDDRAKQANNEFEPLDGIFRKNVIVQVKNGAIDFQPREPFHPLFGAMPKTPLMVEFQITQEYLGFATHLAFLPELFKETLDADTWTNGKGSTVAKVVDGSLDGHSLSGMAGVTNIGNDRNWCGHHFGQANWYGFGRLAWDHSLTPEQIAEEWGRMTFSNDAAILRSIQNIMLGSRETVVNYMTPLGLHHIMGRDHHYGPGPWVTGGRADWTSVYYHRADSLGIGFDRTPTGSNATSQYAQEVAKIFASRTDCPEEFLLWFHHVGWDEKVTSGRTLWEEICHRYYQGVEEVRQMQTEWATLEGRVDAERFEHVSMFLKIQEKEAKLWRDACVLYFQTFSGRAIPEGLVKPEHSLEYYRELRFPYAPGIRPRW
ncbi:MAG: alpha-glucuronidase family glycosyl hydrolase [Bacteroidia bacterium]|nr:alpha-glucuronidase family glycosyl hydrolase [Bacteroidia bacterium]